MPIVVTAKDGRGYVLRFNCAGYPQTPPTAGPWDVERDVTLAFTAGPAVKGAVSVRFPYKLEERLLSIHRAIAKASLAMTTGAPRCHQESGGQPMESFNTWSLSMNFFIAETIARLCAPRHKVACSWLLWHRLLSGLRKRGRHYSRESGAFLLGHRREGRVRVLQFVLYDDLDPECLDTGIVRFDGRHFGKLWDLCTQRGLTVVADVHTHPGSSHQSTLTVRIRRLARRPPR